MCVLVYHWRWLISQSESFSSWNASKSYPELVIGAGTRSISRLLGYCLKTFFCLCDPYFQQGELLLIYSKRFTFVILKINHRFPHLKMSLGITFVNPWPWNTIFIYSMNKWPSTKFWNEDILKVEIQGLHVKCKIAAKVKRNLNSGRIKDHWLLENLKKKNDTESDTELISVRKHHLLHESKSTKPPPFHLCLFHSPIKNHVFFEHRKKKEASGHVRNISRLALPTGAFVKPWGAMTVLSLY